VGEEEQPLADRRSVDLGLSQPVPALTSSRYLRSAALLLAGSTVAMVEGAGQGGVQAPHCEAAGQPVALSELREASGIAVSRRSAGLLWSHNDSGDPLLVALDERGSLKGRIRVSGAKVDDWEDIAVGPCPGGSCVFIADIGDNNASRRRITLYRVAEPSATDTATAAAEVFHATYPDGPRDAEAFFVTSEGRPFIVTKGEGGPIALYRFPETLRSETTARLERVGEAVDRKIDREDQITGAAASPDGLWVALRRHRSISFHRTAELTKGIWQEVGRTDVTGLREPQGEGIAWRSDNSLYLVGEAGRRGRPGTFARVRCTPR
jgi:hypothetical protein